MPACDDDDDDNEDDDDDVLLLKIVSQADAGQKEGRRPEFTTASLM